MNNHNMSPEKIAGLPRYTLNDKLMLGCKTCGKCCHNRGDLILTPYDVFTIAKHLGREPKQIIEHYCKICIGKNSGLPIARVSPLPPSDVCPFLRGKRCGIHSAKPVVCSVYPLARITALDDEQPKFLRATRCTQSPPEKEYRVGKLK